MPYSQIIMRRLMTVPDFSRRAKEQDSISRGIKHHPIMPLLISVALSLLIQAGPTTWNAAVAGDDAANGQGKIVLRADFLHGEHESDWGLFLVDPATDVWTKVAQFTPRNGTPPMPSIRVSPDGTMVVFNEYRQAKDRSHVAPVSVWVQDLRAGASPRKISDIGGIPIWSPAGKQLLVVEVTSDFHSTQPGRYVTWRIDADGSHPVRLPIPESDYVEDWSADGRWLLAVSPLTGKGSELVVMQLDGTGRRRLTGPGQSWSPRFSPDSRHVAYTSDSPEGKSIWVVDIDGLHRRRVFVEKDDSFAERVAWSPDGKHLVFSLLTWTKDGKGGRFLGGETYGSPRLAILAIEDGRVRIIPHPPAQRLGDPQWR
jgi:Tol biopolymer transport system component